QETCAFTAPSEEVDWAIADEAARNGASVAARTRARVAGLAMGGSLKTSPAKCGSHPHKRAFEAESAHGREKKVCGESHRSSSRPVGQSRPGVHGFDLLRPSRWNLCSSRCATGVSRMPAATITASPQ